MTNSLEFYDKNVESFDKFFGKYIRGMDVTYLKRIREGNLLLGDMEKGEWRELDSEEENLF